MKIISTQCHFQQWKFSCYVCLSACLRLHTELLVYALHCILRHLLTLESLYRYSGAYLKQLSFSLLGVKPPQWQGRWWSGVSHGPLCIAGQIHSDEHWSPGGSSERTTGGLCLDETIFCFTLSAVTALLINTSSCKTYIMLSTTPYTHTTQQKTMHPFKQTLSPILIPKLLHRSIRSFKCPELMSIF